MNKSQLIDALAARFEGNKKAAAHALDSVLDTITREVAKGEKVAITGFGSFEKRVRDARWVRNPRTGERIKSKKTAIPKFNPGAELKGVVSGARKLPKLAVDAATGSVKAVTKKAPTKQTGAAKSTAKKAPAKTASTAKKTTGKTASTAKKSTAKTASTAKKTTGKTASAAKKSTGKTASAAKKSTPAKSTAKKAPAKKTAKKS